MKYKFVVDFTPTDPAGEASQRVCSPDYGDDLAVNIEMESDEWYRKRKLEGKLTFKREDYGWIMGRAFDGTFKLTVQSSTDGGATWRPYLEGTFSRANLEIDEDNQNVVLNGLNDGGEYNAIENGKDEEYDLMKIIPDSEAKEVQGDVHPALALVDECHSEISVESSDIYCGGYFQSGGYKSDVDKFWALDKDMRTNPYGRLYAIFAEAKVVMRDASNTDNGSYAGILDYSTYTQHGIASMPDFDFYKTSVVGSMYKFVGENIRTIQLSFPRGGTSRDAYLRITLPNGEWRNVVIGTMYRENTFYSPVSLHIDGSSASTYESVDIRIHYIYASILIPQTAPSAVSLLNKENILETGPYYKYMRPYTSNDLLLIASRNTSETPNGYRMVPETDGVYFAPPDNGGYWHPVGEYNWEYCSLWYYIEPSVRGELLNPLNIGTVSWGRCWTLGTCLDRLLRKITNNKVTFDQSVAGSQFLYATVNPLTQGEPFEYLFTQKSNVMRPSLGGESAARCPVTLDWFLEFMRNALNCYWWLDEQNGGTYAFRVEHVEWFRRGGSYTGQMDAQFNLTEIKPLRNFPRNGPAAKRLDDKLHKYSYDMNGMTEKYLFSWQGDGGSDAFKGNPMFFKAGWVEKGTSESHEVDNIFADLSWLMLNAGTDTASSKNFEGIFVFSGYRAYDNIEWLENSAPASQVLTLADGVRIHVDVDIWMTVPHGVTVFGEVCTDIACRIVDRLDGDGTMRRIHVGFIGRGEVRVNFGTGYGDVMIHRIHNNLTGNVYAVPNVLNRLTEDGYLQNGVLAWPWLQCEFLHYDIPAQRWGYRYDDLDDLDSHQAWETTGTVKMRKKQEVPMLPLPTKSDEENLDRGVIGGLKDSQGQLQTGIVKSATINLGTRNAELTLMYDMIS